MTQGWRWRANLGLMDTIPLGLSRRDSLACQPPSFAELCFFNLVASNSRSRRVSPASGRPKDSLAPQKGKVSSEKSALTPQFGCVPWPGAVRKLREQFATSSHGHKPDILSLLETPAWPKEVDHRVDRGTRSRRLENVRRGNAGGGGRRQAVERSRAAAFRSAL